MSNPKFGFNDAAAVQKHVRLSMQNGSLNISQAFEIPYSVFTRAPKSTCGHYVNDKNELVPIPGAITSYDSDGKPVIACPLPETPGPKRKPLRAVSIDSLVEADGDVDEAEAYEVGVRPEPRRICAGEDVDDDPETLASERAAEVSLNPEAGGDDSE
jgi:hypothetical protein